MDLIRIGDKIISKSKITDAIGGMLALRERGISQAEVAKKYDIDRSFISRLEALGEVRRGRTMALVGFPIENVQEVQEMAKDEGVDFFWLMNDKERWAFVLDKSGIELLNEVTSIIYKLRQFDIVILLGSDERIRLGRALFDQELLTLELGKSPLTADIKIDVQELRKTIRKLKKRDDLS